MARSLTKKQAKFVEEYLKPGVTGTEAALRAYPSVKNDTTAAVISSENLRNPNVIPHLGDRISDDLVVERINDLLNKKETYWDIDPNTKQRKLVRTKEIHVPGVSRGLEATLRVKGLFNPEVVPQTPTNTYNFFHKPEIRVVTDKYEGDLKKILYENEQKKD